MRRRAFTAAALARRWARRRRPRDRPGMAEQAVAHGHPLPARRTVRRLDPHRHGSRRAEPGPAHRVRQQGRRLGHDRRGVRQEPDGRQPHLPDHDHGDGLHHAPSAADPVRSREGLRDGLAHVHLVGHLRHPPVGAGAHGRRVRGLRQGQPGQDQLRLVGACHHHPPVRRDAAARGRHQDDPRALSRQRARHQRPGRGRGAGAVRPDLPAAREGGQARRPRHAVERPPSRLPRRARPCARRAIARRKAIPGSASWPPPARRRR